MCSSFHPVFKKLPNVFRDHFGIFLKCKMPGVKQVVMASTENIICQQNEALIPGTLTVSAL